MKALVLSLVLTMLCALSVSAQQRSENFFRVGDEYGGTRDGITYWTAANGINNNGIGQSESPIGSGLLILTAAGAGYAVMKRRKSHKFDKKGTTLLLAFAMLLGMTGCKKNVETLSHVGINTAHITLKVDDGSKVIVNPTGGNGYATVTYEDGDIIYVGYNNQYVGTLTYKVIDEETKYFEGDITIGAQVDDQPLHFYFLGGKGFTPTINDNTATVNISDQTSKYPVISYAASNENYPTTSGGYTARLFNKCSIVKFNVTKPAGFADGTTTIMGMNNQVTVDFTNTNAEENYGITYQSVGGGLITMPSNTGEMWAILLPQSQVTNAVAYSTNLATQNPVTVPEIIVNQYKPDGIALNLTDTYISVSATKKVRFAQGNLQYLGKTGAWRFAEHQYDFIGSGPSSGDSYQGNVTIEGYNSYNNSSATDAARDLFGWGTSGYNNVYPYFTYSYESPYPAVSMIDDNVNYDWGVYHSKYGSSTSKITNGGDWSWRLLALNEWSYIMNRTKTIQTQQLLAENKSLWAAATVNGVTGIVIYPDNWTGWFELSNKYGSQSNFVDRVYDVNKWTKFEKMGCVFLPAVCYRSGTSLSTANSKGLYWSSTLASNNRGNDLEIGIKAGVTYGDGIRNTRPIGECVRLVREIE